MASCLGLYIENNLIKYAKVSKEKDGFRMDSYGIKFYSNINEAIEQIVQETNSMKTPISVNIVDESYQYFSMFSQLNKKDLLLLTEYYQALKTKFIKLFKDNNKKEIELYKKIINLDK